MSPCPHGVSADLHNKALKKFPPNRLTMRILLEAKVTELENKLGWVTLSELYQWIISNILENSKILFSNLDQMHVELIVRKLSVRN